MLFDMLCVIQGEGVSPSPILRLFTGGRAVKKWPVIGYVVCVRSVNECFELEVLQ